jgi:prepilin-type N-terminal cleavage/methylation domain-containing protein
MTNKNIHTKGFTLVETLIAIFVLSIALAGPLTIAQKGLQTALISKDQVTAFYLAQDAIEYVRYARDTNCLVTGSGVGGCQAAGQWLAGNGNANQTINLTPCVSSGGTSACTIDVIAGNSAWPPTTCGGSVCTTPINYDSSHNYFTYASGSASIFTRTIAITSPVCNVGNTLCNPNEAGVTVTVTWSDPLLHTITVKENLLDWQ